MTVIEQLNNAIHSLAQLNPQLTGAVQLNERWQDWYTKVRAEHPYVPDPFWFALLSGFWVAYASVRATAPVLSSRTPAASEIDPSLWALAKDAYRLTGEGPDEVKVVAKRAADDAVELIRQETADAADALQRMAAQTIKPLLFVAVVVAGAFWVRGRW